LFGHESLLGFGGGVIADEICHPMSCIPGMAKQLHRRAISLSQL
jgi:hypothetical protein